MKGTRQDSLTTPSPALWPPTSQWLSASWDIAYIGSGPVAFARREGAEKRQKKDFLKGFGAWEKFT